MPDTNERTVRIIVTLTEVGEKAYSAKGVAEEMALDINAMRATPGIQRSIVIEPGAATSPPVALEGTSTASSENSTVAPTYQITIFVAGDPAVAKQVVREYCYQFGLCVTVTPTSFIYPGGEEYGVMIGLLNYPRYPVESKDLWAEAERLARILIPRLNQRSCLVVGPLSTKRLVIQAPGAKQQKE